ncbi:MAG: hypothetical protein RL684_1968 [Pseudomonadota bacterium]|jgi:hypothetical protein
MNSDSAISYWNGSKIRFTGEVVQLYGGTFYRFEFLDGHRKGEFGLTSRAPKVAA